MAKVSSILTLEDLPSICRVCLKKNSVLSISQVDFKHTDAKTIFRVVLQEELDDGDKPQNICIYCIRMMTQFYYFLNMYNKCKGILEDFLQATFEERHAVVKAEPLENIFSEVIVDPLELKVANEIVVQTTSSPDTEIDVPSGANLPPLILIPVVKRSMKQKEQPNNEKKRRGGRKKMEVQSKPVEDRIIQCNFCFKNLPRRLLLDHRKAEHSDLVEKGVKIHMYETCALCDKKVERRLVKYHFRSKHNNEPVQIKPGATEIVEKLGVSCELCGKMVESKRMKRHYRFAHKGVELKYTAKEASEVCALCNKRMGYRSLRHHFERFHKGEEIQTKPGEGTAATFFTCEICGKQVHYNYLRKHYKTVHESEKLYQEGVMCEKCGRYFWTKSQMNVHFKKAHEGFRYYCELCPDKSFTTKHTLRRHALRIHKK